MIRLAGSLFAVLMVFLFLSALIDAVRPGLNY